MKIKFDFTEEMRLKAYYALSIQRILDPGLTSQVTFDDWCNRMAEEAFCDHLNSVIYNLNNLLERSLENGKTSNEKVEG